MPDINKTYTHLNMEAGLCLWEAMLDANSAAFQKDPSARSDAEETLLECWENLGYAEMRMKCIELIPLLEEIWAELPDTIKDSSSFDWDFCPIFVQVTNWLAEPQKDKILANILAQSLRWQIA